MKSDRSNEELDLLLKSCLHTEQEPGDVLHRRIMQKWKEQSDMRKKKSYKAAAAAAVIVMMTAVSAGAAMRFLTPGEAASEMSGTEVAGFFETDDAVLVNETKEGTKYAFTLLGMTEGKNLMYLDEDGGSLQQDTFYAVVAITDKDGGNLSLEEFHESENGYFISPLIQGQEPWMYNIASMNGGYSEAEIDGVVYRMIDCDKISYFADRNLYLCISDTSFYETDAYNYDAESGTITRNADYDGTNLLFDLPIDKSKADAEAAAQYLKTLEDEWSSDENADDEGGLEIGHPAAQADYEVFQEAVHNAPDEVEAVLANMGMKAVGQHTAEKKDGVYRFAQELEDGGSSDMIFFEESFENGLADNILYSESNTESKLVIAVARMHEDKTVTCTFYEKTYLSE